MNYFTFFPVFAFCLGLFNLSIAWKNREIPGAKAFLGLAFGIQIYAFGNIIEVNSVDLEQAIFWDNIQFIGSDLLLLFLPLVFLGIIGKLSRLSLLLLLPITIFLLINEYIAWFQPELVRIDPVMLQSGTALLLKYNWGTWLNIYAYFAIFEYLIFSSILIRFGLFQKGLRKRQIFITLLGLWFPFVSGVLTSFGLIPFIHPRLDLSPLTYSIGNLIWAYGLYNLKIFNLVPLARDSIFQSLHDAILVTSDDMQILDANDSACNFFQIDFKILTKSKIKDLAPELYPELVKFKEKSWHEFEWVANRDSEKRSFLISIQEVFFQNENFKMVVIKDITESKLAYERTEVIRQQKNELEMTLTDLKKAQDQLILSEKMASLGSLISGIAHEINNPIAAIKATNSANTENVHSLYQLYFQFLGEIQFFSETQRMNILNWMVLPRIDSFQSKLPDHRKKRIAFVEQLTGYGIADAENLAEDLLHVGIHSIPEDCLFLFQDPKHSVVSQFIMKFLVLLTGLHLIDFAVQRTTKIVYSLRNFIHTDPNSEKKEIKVSDTIETVLTLYQNQWKADVEIIRDYEYDPPTSVYPEDLLQVWTNLIQNALHAMSFKGILRISLSKHLVSEKNYLKITIEDNGRGIPPEIQAKVFQPFFTTKPPGEGTGLGLEIVRSIIDKHKGELTFESKPGETIFSILLPL